MLAVRDDHRARPRPARGLIPAIAGLVAGLAVIVLGALTWGGGPLGVVPLAIQLVVLAAATGGVFAAMILGHWYLVTPRLPEAPLVLVSRRLLWIVALQIVLFLAWVGFGAGPGGGGGGAVLGARRARGRCSCGCGCWSGSCSR